MTRGPGAADATAGEAAAAGGTGRRAPEIAVVVITSGREARLSFLLEALAAQTLDPERFEVIVVRDPRPGPLVEPPPKLRVRTPPRPAGMGLGAARNIGWRASAAPLVAFTDDDCRPSPGWLAGLLRAAGGEDLLLQGPTEPDPDERHLMGGLARSQFVSGPSEWYETCNIAYPRALLERLGGFDERFAAAGEDTDLGLRALEQGARRGWVSDALVWHAVHTPHLPDALSRALAWDWVAELIARHPAQRRALYYGVFWKEAHGKLTLAILGAAAGRRRPVLKVAAALPYLEYRLRGNSWRPRPTLSRSLWLPSRLLVDLTEMAVTLRAAARHRTLVI